jgi:hypothetical protein
MSLTSNYDGNEVGVRKYKQVKLNDTYVVRGTAKSVNTVKGVPAQLHYH